MIIIQASHLGAAGGGRGVDAQRVALVLLHAGFAAARRV
jgi:hypothetical protein